MHEPSRPIYKVKRYVHKKLFLLSLHIDESPRGDVESNHNERGEGGIRQILSTNFINFIAIGVETVL